MEADGKKKKLIAAARAVAAHSHCPESHFAVGAAVLIEDGQIFTGTNVENPAYGNTICAERGALMALVAAIGWRRVVAAAVMGGHGASPVTPCGACRQSLAEFMADDGLIHCGTLDESGPSKAFTLGYLLPHAFRRFVL